MTRGDDGILHTCEDRLPSWPTEISPETRLDRAECPSAEPRNGLSRIVGARYGSDFAKGGIRALDDI